MTETLKPCPFCGGEAEIRGDDAPENWVSCKADCQPSGRDKERLVRAWNTRASSQSMSNAKSILPLISKRTLAALEKLRKKNESQTLRILIRLYESRTRRD